MNINKLTQEEIKQIYNQYMRKYRARNKERIKKINKKYYNKSKDNLSNKHLNIVKITD